MTAAGFHQREGMRFVKDGNSMMQRCLFDLATDVNVTQEEREDVEKI